MTLVVINKDNHNISFSADTRISFGGHGYFDNTIKVFKVPCRIKGPTKSIESSSQYEFEYDYGVAVVGNSINAFTIKDSIAELLFHIQYLSNTSDISIIGISTLVLEVYSRVSAEICSLLREQGICEIILGGYCVVNQQIRVIRFYPKIENTEQTFHFEEILKNGGKEFFGSGSKIAKSIIKSDISLSPLKIIKQVIASNEEKSVGGSVQQGSFGSDNNFRILAINNKLDPETKIRLHGFPFEQKNFTTKYPQLYITYYYSNELNE